MEHYICEKCGSSFERSIKGYKKRFCSRSCANSRKWSKEASKKRAKTNKETWAKMKPEILKERKKKMASITKKRMATYQNTFMSTNFDMLPHGTKRRRILIEQNNCCLECGIKEWRGNPISLELDHIDGNRKNETRNNLRYLCPNCHAQTPTWRGRKNGPIAQLVEPSPD
jgi:nitrate reductase cytochrome c-type subunit